MSEQAARAVVADPGISESAFIGKFYSDFFLVVNFVGLAIQFFLVSRILKYLGVRVALLFLPTTREQKYKAKQAIDTIFARWGDALSALLVFVGTTFLSFQTRRFAMVNMAFVGVWVVLAVMTGMRFSKLMADRGSGSD